jgi:RNA polymerase sigma-70 factor (ECF subfamily)
MTDTALFDAARRRLFGLAYRMLGSRAEAEDIVQEAYVRWHQADRSAIATPEAWLVTTATRLAIDRLRRLKTERESYQGPWLPEPIVDDASRPDRGLDVAADLSMAMLTLLETLAPEERAAFLLHEVFDVDYARIGAILGRSEPACRQMIHRARERVRGTRRRFEADEEAKRALVEQFKAATDAADESALLALFTPGVTWTADGGGRTAASPRPIVGLDKVVRLILGLRRKWLAGLVLDVAVVNGEPGMVVRQDGRITAVLAVDVEDGKIAAVYGVINPDKLPVQ